MGLSADMRIGGQVAWYRVGLDRPVLFFITPETAAKWDALFTKGEDGLVMAYTFPAVERNPRETGERRLGWMKVALAPGEALVLTMMPEDTL